MNKSLKKIIILLVCVLSAGAAVAQMSYIVPVPPAPIAITSPPCVTCITYPDSIVYSVVGEPGMTYEWTLPAGWTQTSGGNTNRITVKPPDYNPSDIVGFIGNVTISVAAINNFGKSVKRVSSNIKYQNIPMPTFAPYNLGADPTLDNPKKQIEYLASAAFTGNSQRNYDGRVYGGRYQWGRDNAGDYAINPSTYVIPTGTGLSNKQTVIADNATFDANGQIVTNPFSAYPTDRADTVFVSSTTAPFYDWHISSPNGAKQDDLWGNGRAINAQTNMFSDKGIKVSGGGFFQSTSWALPQNNPCAKLGPDWRVPTQDEFERLFSYDCDLQDKASNTTISISATMLWATTNTGFTWVKVANGVPALTWSTANGNGFAIYRTDDWNAAIAAGGYFEGLQQNGTGLVTTKKLYDTSAPMPFLFLPAAGQRIYNGDTASAGQVGFYSTATISGSVAYELRFSGTSSSTSISVSQQLYRSVGNSIRCVK